MCMRAAYTLLRTKKKEKGKTRISCFTYPLLKRSHMPQQARCRGGQTIASNNQFLRRHGNVDRLLPSLAHCIAASNYSCIASASNCSRQKQHVSRLRICLFSQWVYASLGKSGEAVNKKDDFRKSQVQSPFDLSLSQALDSRWPWMIPTVASNFNLESSCISKTFGYEVGVLGWSWLDIFVFWGRLNKPSSWVEAWLLV